MPAMRKALAAICLFTAAASCWLTVMFFVLRRPGYQWRALVAALFVTQSVVTLIALSGYLRGIAIRILVLVGAGGIAIAGVQAMMANAAAPHGEGYIDVIALALITQAALTMWVFARPSSLARS
jgi:hypothetical protein